MKQITNINDLTEGQEVYLKCKVEFDYDFDDYPIYLRSKDDFLIHYCSTDFKVLHTNRFGLELFTSEPTEQFIPEVGKEYEFSDDGKYWIKGVLKGFYEIDYGWKHIRPITPLSKEEARAIELLKSLGYKIDK